jgi:peptidoglycan hydrolase-like protein with peptidoglycan-binding domain
VRQIQTFLNAFRVGSDATLTVDGSFGNLTAARLRDWQSDQGLTSDGLWNGDDAARARSLIGGGGAATWIPLGNVNGPLRFTSPNGENSAAARDSVLGLCNGAGGVTHYRGSLEFRHEASANRVINDVKTEDYLRGVVPKEISASWANAGGGRGLHAVMAQAVAARSYALQPGRWSDAICDTQSCQVYFGAATRTTPTGPATRVEFDETDMAIALTAGKVRRWPSGAIVSTEFSASNGPRTAGGAFPPRDDTPGDGTATNPNHRWTRVLDADTLAAQYGLGTLTGATMVDAASAANQQFDGIWFNDIVLTGTAGTRRIPAWDFRGVHGLPSPGFTVRIITRDTVTPSVALIGDSVGNSIAGTATSEFRTLTDGTFPALSIDVLDSRFITKTPPSPSGVQAAASA